MNILCTYLIHELQTESPCLLQERMKDFGQSDLIAAEDTNGIGPVERAAIWRLKELDRDGLEKLMKEHQLDAIVAPNYDTNKRVQITKTGHYLTLTGCSSGD